MSIEEFVVEIQKENREDLEELVRLQEILDQLARERTEIYVASVTSNL